MGCLGLHLGGSPPGEACRKRAAGFKFGRTGRDCIVKFRVSPLMESRGKEERREEVSLWAEADRRMEGGGRNDSFSGHPGS